MLLSMFLCALYGGGLLKAQQTRGDLTELGLLGKVSTDQYVKKDDTPKIPM